MWALTHGFLLFGVIPNRWTVLGAAIMVEAGLYRLAYDAMAQRKGPVTRE